jgi:hypothetical protein
MALTDRQRARMRGALEAILRAEDAVTEVADEHAHAGDPGPNAALDRAASLIKELISVIEPLAGGRTR